MLVDDGEPVRARIPADVNAPDRVLFGLTARQVVVAAAVLAPAYLIWRALQDRVPPGVRLAAAAPVAAVAVALAVGRRDGIGLDGWLAAAARQVVSPRRLVPATGDGAGRGLAALQLPARRIGPDGVIDLAGGQAAAVVASTTINTGLLAGPEQASLVAGFARWLNALTGPAQIVVSARRCDLGSRALRITDGAHELGSEPLRRAALGHARFLLDLATDQDPLTRTVAVACTAPTRDEAARRAARTAHALAGLGVRTRVLDGPGVTALLAGAVDPFTPADHGRPRTPPDQPVTTGPPADDREQPSGPVRWEAR